MGGLHFVKSCVSLLLRMVLIVIVLLVSMMCTGLSQVNRMAASILAQTIF